jgi:prepilin-type N-terminal cleavage/methylation domain-containing protein/prepilin-type processing-associated H-X9-DG protein
MVVCRVRRHGFTLVELLVVIAIIGILVGLLLPAVQAAREAARRMQCSNNLKQLALSLHNYESAHKRFPSGTFGILNSTRAVDYDYNGPSWMHMILPYIELGNLFDQMSPQMSSNVPVHLYNGRFNVLPAFVCPSDPQGPKVSTITTQWWGNHGFHGNYAACAGSRVFTPNAAVVDNPATLEDETDVADFNMINRNGMFFAKSRTRIGDLSDGTSNTIMLGELLVVRDTALSAVAQDLRGAYQFGRRGASLFSTLEPPNTFRGDVVSACVDTRWTPCGARSDVNMAIFSRSQHTGGANMARADGSVTFAPQSVDRIVFQSLGTRARGEVVNSDF